APRIAGAASRLASSSSANSGRFATSSAALTPSAWPQPSHRNRRRRSENFALSDERHQMHRRIGLQIDDRGVGRYLAIPRIDRCARPRVRRRLEYPAALGLDPRSSAISSARSRPIASGPAPAGHPETAEDPLAVIGQSPRRKEDQRLITGRGRFIDDIAPSGVVHLALVRSTHARARIVAVDATAARTLPDVSVFLADDLPGLADPLSASRADRTNPYVRLDTPRPQRPLARSEVRYVGEPIAAVIAPDPYRAADAAELIRVEYEAWPAVVDAEAAMSAASPSVHEGASNVVGQVVKVIGDVERM